MHRVHCGNILATIIIKLFKSSIKTLEKHAKFAHNTQHIHRANVYNFHSTCVT